MTSTASLRPRLDPPRVYAIADVEALGSKALGAAVMTMASEGCGWIQVRNKGRLTDAELYSQLADCCQQLAGSGIRLWIDDRADLAAVLPLAGVHLGQKDLPPGAAREVVGPHCWIGHSTHSLVQAKAADADPAVDVVALGPIFPTQSKETPDPAVGLALLREVRLLTSKPLVAIGGIDASNAGAVLAAGADTVAVIGAVCRDRDVAAACRRLVAATTVTEGVVQ